MQRRYYNFRDDDDTESLNRWRLGIIDQGLYRGFDPVLGADMVLTLNHITTGAKEVAANGNIVSNVGVISTAQGVIIKEYDPVSITIPANNSGSVRVDYIVCEHVYTLVEGGSPGLYKVVQGGVGGIEPTLTQFQTLLGKITIPSGTTALNAGASYFRPLLPEFGGSSDNVKLGTDQTITGNKIFKSVVFSVGAGVISDDGTMTLTGKYNRYKVTYSGTVYPAVEKIDISGESIELGYQIEIFTEDAKGILFTRDTLGDANANIMWGASSDSVSSFYVGPNEYTRFAMKVASEWWVESCPVDLALRDVKITTLFKLNKSERSLAPNVGVSLNIFDNFLDVTSADGAYIFALSAIKNPVTAAADDKGARVAIRCNGSNSLELRHNHTATSVDLPAKVMLLAGNANITMQPGEVIYFLEDATNWRMVGYYSPDNSEARFRKDTMNVFSATQSWNAVTLDEHTELENGYFTLFLPPTGNMFLIEYTGSNLPMQIGDVKQEGGERFPAGTRLVLQFRKKSTLSNNSVCSIHYDGDPLTGYDGNGIRKPFNAAGDVTNYTLIPIGVSKGTFGACVELVADSAGKWMHTNYTGNSGDTVEWTEVAAYDGAGGGTGDNDDTNVRVGILGRNWQIVGSYPLKYKKDSAGNVHVKGYIKVTGNNTGNIPTFQKYITRLPDGMRPAQLSVHFYCKNFNQVGYPVDIYVETDGRIRLAMDTGIVGTSGTYPPLSFGTEQSIYLYISFPAEQ